VWQNSCNNVQNIKSKKGITEKMGVTQTILERMKTNMFKWYGHVICMGDNIWPKQILTWLPEGIKRRARPKI
jgi:hypothetical protein